MSVILSRMALGVLVFSLSINSALALPIDWNGVFGVDTHLLSNTCRTKDTVTKVPGSGTQGISGDCGASFQTYVFKLNPQIIVNDGVTLKGELSSGFIRGGFAGSEATNTQDASGNTGNNSYFFVTPAQRSALNVNQMYMELYADAALVKLGRFSKHYGLGSIFDNGTEAWDRFFTMYDGVEAEMKISNFSLIPYWAKISSFKEPAATSTASAPSGTFDVRETGVVAKYDNKNRDLVVSVLYAKRFSERQNALYNSSTSHTSAIDRGKTEVTIIDPYISKRWNKFKIAAEFPMLTGDYGNAYGLTPPENAKITANAYILEASYEMNPKWDIGLNGGQVTGDKGSTGKFEGNYLHPNYQVAELMFRYRYNAFTEGNENIFNSSITNSRYLKLYANYKTDKWTWKGAFITANALETAEAGSDAYHHEENYRFAATETQADDLGHEVDVGFDYRWNPNVIISGYYGYWFVGDYYSFSNTATELEVSDVHGGGLRATLEF
ncbi:MAG TPA: hypothetical protein VNJ08_10145 [Bacteriovoracaceae bacterium]|nr:hypothetical protein [Bacteriovoracaceae bacterium]